MISACFAAKWLFIYYSGAHFIFGGTGLRLRYGAVKGMGSLGSVGL